MPAIKDIIGARRALYSVPDDEVNASVDVTPWLEQKVAAILALRSEVAPGGPSL